MAKKIQTMHPNHSKQGVNIDKDKYDVILKAIITVLGAKKVGYPIEISFKELVKAVKSKLHSKFEGSISWYVTTVKLDLEARRFIQRFSVKGIQYLKIIR